MGLSTKRKQACFLPRLFQPRGTNEVVRLGPDNRGGHVIAADAVASTRNLLSLGLQPDFKFEVDFAAMARLKHLHGHDPGISADTLKKAHRRAMIPFFGNAHERRRAISLFSDYKALFIDRGPDFIHHPSAIGGDGRTFEDALAAFKSEPGQTFLKCDIDGGEYDILDAIIENNALLSGFALVLNDVPARLREITVFLMAMKEFMVLDNMAADNVAGANSDGTPIRLEMTMSSKFRNEPHIPIAGATKRYKILNEPNDPSRIEFEILYVT